jgi:hypothetical protein
MERVLETALIVGVVWLSLSFVALIAWMRF